MESEERCFKKLQSGHIEPIYKRLYPQLLSYAIRALGDFAFMAEDCVQDSFVKAYSGNKYKEYLHFKSFLYTCMRNQIISILRHNRAQDNYISSLSNESSPAYINTIIEEETYTILYQSIQELPKKLQEVFELSFIEGMTNIEIAKKLGISERTVKRRKAQMIETLRETLLKQDDFDLSILGYLLTIVCYRLA